MTKTELLAAMAKRYREGRKPGQAGNDWAAGFRVAIEFVRREWVTSWDADPEPRTVVMAADTKDPRTVYAPPLDAYEVCGPFNPDKAIHASGALYMADRRKQKQRTA